MSTSTKQVRRDKEPKMTGKSRRSYRKLAVAAFLLLWNPGARALSAQAAPSADALPLKVNGNVTPPVRLSGAPPVYPEIARRAGVQGKVIVEAIIDQQGDVKNTRVLQGLPLGLDKAAVEAVKTWKFKPSTLEGKPVKVYYVLTVNFSTEEGVTFYGPRFRQFLEKNKDFSQAMVFLRYQEAAQLLDRRVMDPEVALARCYVLLEQKRFKEAWQEAQTYRGPDAFELPYAVGLFASRRLAADKVASPEARAEILEVGLQAETRAMEERKDLLVPVLRKGELLRQKAKLTSDPKEKEALDAEIGQLMAWAGELRRTGKTGDPFASPSP
jgi:TonB family protein